MNAVKKIVLKSVFHRHSIGFWCLLLLCGQLSCVDKSAEMVVPTCVDETPLAVEDCSLEIEVAGDQCILEEVIIGQGERRFLYFHDGQNYNSIEYEEQFDDSVYFSWQMDLFYDETGRVTRTFQQITQGVGLEFLFKYQGSEVFIRTALYDTLGNFDSDLGTTTTLYAPEVQDSLFYLDYSTEFIPDQKYLMGFENGNRISFYEFDEEGDCVIYEERWFHTGKFYFDDRNNIFEDYAVRVSTGLEHQFWWQMNTHNFIASADPRSPELAPVVSCLTFLKGQNDQFWIKNYNSRTYYYDCEG